MRSSTVQQHAQERFTIIAVSLTNIKSISRAPIGFLITWATLCCAHAARTCNHVNITEFCMAAAFKVEDITLTSPH